MFDRCTHLALLAALLLAAASAPTAAARDEVPPGLAPADPVVCGGNQEVLVRNVYIRTGGDGVVAGGNCEVEIVGSLIEAGGFAVLAQSNAEVEVFDSFLSGRRGALVAENRAEIGFRDSTIRGAIAAHNLAEIEDEGGNDVSDRVSDRASAERDEPGGAEMRVGGSEIRVGAPGAGVRVTPEGIVVGDEVAIQIGADGSVRIDTPEETVEVGDVVSVESAEESVLVTPEGVYVDDGTAVEMGPGGEVLVTADDETILVEDGYLRVSGGGEVVEIAGDWRAAGRVYGAGDTARLLLDLGANVDAGKLLLRMAGDVLFDFASAELLPEAAEELAKVAHLIRDRAVGTVYVVGHTDSVGAEAFNQELSQRRALAVMRWLNAREGIPFELMAGQGRGEASPVAYNTMPDGSDNPEGRARNRRVELSFTVDER